MNCPSCGAAMRLEEDKEFLRCDYCKNIFFPEKNDDGVRVLIELSELACPACAVPLVHAALEGWRMLYCSKCRGMLISADIFVELILDLHAHSDGSGAVPRAPDPTIRERSHVAARGGRGCHRHAAFTIWRASAFSRSLRALISASPARMSDPGSAAYRPRLTWVIRPVSSRAASWS